MPIELYFRFHFPNKGFIVALGINFRRRANLVGAVHILDVSTRSIARRCHVVGDDAAFWVNWQTADDTAISRPYEATVSAVSIDARRGLQLAVHRSGSPGQTGDYRIQLKRVQTMESVSMPTSKSTCRQMRRAGRNVASGTNRAARPLYTAAAPRNDHDGRRYN
ncbi:unnamed protein product, partial [Iphiclides podalirius]